MIKRIKFVSVPVSDQNRALDFYTEKLLEQKLAPRELGQDIRKHVLPYVSQLPSAIEKAHFIKTISQKAFIKELDELDPEQDDIEERLVQTILSEIQRHITLFTSDEVDDPILSELEKYLIERFVSNNS